MSTRKIIIDTDPGQDDAIAILLALASAELEVLGITCVSGNVPLSLTTRNALLICELAGRVDMSVFAGCDRPMVRPLVTAEAVHGNTGLDGPEWDEPTMSLSAVHAVDWMIETLMGSNDGEITVCPVGPLTNIGMALVREPRIAPKIAEIVTMGGAYFVGGNVTPGAEFNVYVDPHAAEVVYSSGIPIVTRSLDVTHRALMSPEWVQSIADIGTTVGQKASQMLSFYDRRDAGRHGERGGPVHDPATIAYLLSPSLYSGKDAHVAIETASELTMGMTVVDYWGRHAGEPNAHWITEVDSDGFFELIGSRLALL